MAATTIPCTRCTQLIPVARLKLGYTQCIACNKLRPRKVYVEVMYGFKGNGTCLAPLADQAAHAENVVTRG